MFSIGKVKNNIFSIWLISYVLILLIPITVMVYSYFKSMEALEKQIKNVNISSLEQVKHVIDGKLVELENVLLQLNLNDNNKILFRSKIEMDQFYRYRMLQFKEELNTYKISNKFINEIYIYYYNNNYILSNEGVKEPFYHFNLKYDTDMKSYESWLESLKQKYFKEYTQVYVKDSKGKSHSTVDFIQSLPIENIQEAQATLVVTLNKSLIEDTINLMKWSSKGYIAILDKNDRVIATTNSLNSVYIPRYDQLMEKSGINTFKLKDGNVVICHIVSQVNDWKYIAVIPNDVFLHQARNISKIIIISISLCFLLGLVVSYIFTKKNYNVIQRIVKIFENKTGQTFKGKYNEYSFIEKSILDIIEQEEAIKDQLQTQENIIRDDILRNVLRGKIDAGYGANILKDDCKLSIDGASFGVIMFYIRNKEESLASVANEHKAEVFDLNRYIIMNICRELMPAGYTINLVEENDMVVGIISIEKDELDLLQSELLNAVMQINQALIDKYGIHCAISLSNLHKSIANLSIAYNEAHQAMEYKLVMNDNTVEFFKKDKQYSNTSLDYKDIFDLEEKFINSLKTFNFKDSKDLLEKIFFMYFDVSREPVKIVNCHLSSLINIMINYIRYAEEFFSADFLKEMDVINKLISCKTVQEVKYHMNYILIQMEIYATEEKRNHIVKIKDVVEKWIDEHYKDNDLSVSMLANKLQVSVTYLSKAFKKQTGIGLLEYIHKIRIDKSKDLLKQNYSIKEISEMVGYISDISYIKVFKKYEGITPGQYKGSMVKVEKKSL